MNYVSPTLYFQPDDELCFHTSIPNHHLDIIQDNLIPNPPMFVEKGQNLQTVKSRKAGGSVGGDADDRCSKKKKKIIHRDVERQRRQDMSTLYMTLRSLLPLDYHKGKRSISDHMNEATNYIRQLENKIQQLKEKRDRLKRVTSSLPNITVRTTLSGAAVVIVGSTTVELQISRVIAALLEEGLNVVSISSYINGQSVYTFECEITDPKEVDAVELEQKLRDFITLLN